MLKSLVALSFVLAAAAVLNFPSTYSVVTNEITRDVSFGVPGEDKPLGKVSFLSFF